MKITRLEIDGVEVPAEEYSEASICDAKPARLNRQELEAKVAALEAEAAELRAKIAEAQILDQWRTRLKAITGEGHIWGRFGEPELNKLRTLLEVADSPRVRTGAYSWSRGEKVYKEWAIVDVDVGKGKITLREIRRDFAEDPISFRVEDGIRCGRRRGNDPEIDVQKVLAAWEARET